MANGLVADFPRMAGRFHSAAMLERSERPGWLRCCWRSSARTPGWEMPATPRRVARRCWTNWRTCRVAALHRSGAQPVESGRQALAFDL